MKKGELKKIGREFYQVGRCGIEGRYSRLVIPQSSGIENGDKVEVYQAQSAGGYTLETGDIIIRVLA